VNRQPSRRLQSRLGFCLAARHVFGFAWPQLSSTVTVQNPEKLPTAGDTTVKDLVEAANAVHDAAKASRYRNCDMTLEER